MKVLTRRFDWMGDAIPGEQNTRIVGAAPPTATAGGGTLTLALTAANEAQVAGWDLGDENPFPVARVLRARFWIEMDVALSAAECSIYWGLGSDYDAVIGNIAEHVAFGINGANDDVIVRAQDGTNTLAETEIGVLQEITDPVRKYEINLADGIHSQSPPLAQEGGRARCGFYVSSDFGEARRINLGAARANISAYAGGVQPFVKLAKTGGAGVGTASIHAIEIDYLVPN